MKQNALPQIYKHWLFPAIIISCSVGIMVFGDLGRTLFRYHNTWLQDREYWRILTGHLTHLGWSHFFLNIAGFIAVWALYGKVFNARIWAIIFLCCCMGISLGFYFFDQNLSSYVGLSGALHGLIAAALLGSFFQSKHGTDRKIPWEDALIFIGLTSKILYEQVIGAVPLTQSASGGNVIVNAHFYGAIIGAVCGCVIVGISHSARRIN